MRTSKLDSCYPTASEMEKEFRAALPKPVISRTGRRYFQLKSGESFRMRELVAHAEKLSENQSATPEGVYKLSSFLMWADIKGKYELRHQGSRLQKIGNLIRRFFSFSKESHYKRLFKMAGYASMRGGVAEAKKKDVAWNEDLQKLRAPPFIKAEFHLEQHMIEEVARGRFPKDPKQVDGYSELEKEAKAFLKKVEKLYLSDRTGVAIRAIRAFTNRLATLSFCLVHFSDLKEIDQEVIDLLKASQAHNCWIPFSEGQKPLWVLPINSVYGTI